MTGLIAFFAGWILLSCAIAAILCRGIRKNKKREAAKAGRFEA